MKITGCEILHCDAGWRIFSFLKLTSDEGVSGIAEYNECYGSPGLSEVIRRIVDWIVGRDPMAHENILQELYFRTRQASGGVNQQALAAIENALVDLKARALGVPVYQLLGGKMRDALELYWSHAGTYLMNPEIAAIIGREPLQRLDDLVALGRRIRESGFANLKTNIFLFDQAAPQVHMAGFARGPGWPEINWNRRIVAGMRDQLQALREGIGPDGGIHLDLNFNFKTEGYMQVTRALDDLGLTWFEIDIYDAPALRDIRQSIDTPIASCESLFGLRQFKPFFEAYAMDVPIIDVPWNGIWQGLKIAAVAESYELNIAPHNFYGNLSTLMSAHLCAAVPNFRIMEIDIDDVPWKADLLTVAPEIVDGRLIVPDGPGWGAELNEEAIRAHPPKWDL